MQGKASSQRHGIELTLRTRFNLLPKFSDGGGAEFTDLKTPVVVPRSKIALDGVSFELGPRVFAFRESKQLLEPFARHTHTRLRLTVSGTVISDWHGVN